VAGNSISGKRVGVLALQGDFEKHQKAVERAGAEQVEVRDAKQFDGLDGLVIPGGESTTMLRLMDYFDMFEALRRFGMEKPIFGTCAGAILLAKDVTSPAQKSLGLMDIGVERNAYGRQVDSRIAEIPSRLGELEAVFIRAPIIRRVGPGVEVMAEYAGDPVLVRDGKHWAATFHPELTEDARIHRAFIETL
jgi:pyridoxal 5'-phosphate synthase pdxT subunit